MRIMQLQACKNHECNLHDSVASSLQGKGIRQHGVNSHVMHGHAHEATTQLNSLISYIRENSIGSHVIGCDRGNSHHRELPTVIATA